MLKLKIVEQEEIKTNKIKELIKITAFYFEYKENFQFKTKKHIIYQDSVLQMVINKIHCCKYI